MTDIYLGEKRVLELGLPDENMPMVRLQMWGHPKSLSGGEMLLADVLTPAQARAFGQLLLDEAAVAMSESWTDPCGDPDCSVCGDG